MGQGDPATKPAIGRAAHALYSGFLASQAEFEFVTRRARERFLERDWHGHQADAVGRLRVYRAALDRLQVRLRELLGDALRRREPWIEIKRAYRELIAGQQNAELCETFFNSMTRRVFSTVGVDPDIEFVTLEEAPASLDAAPAAYRVYPGTTSPSSSTARWTTWPSRRAGRTARTTCAAPPSACARSSSASPGRPPCRRWSSCATCSTGASRRS